LQGTRSRRAVIRKRDADDVRRARSSPDASLSLSSLELEGCGAAGAASPDDRPGRGHLRQWPLARAVAARRDDHRRLDHLAVRPCIRPASVAFLEADPRSGWGQWEAKPGTTGPRDSMIVVSGSALHAFGLVLAAAVFVLLLWLQNRLTSVSRIRWLLVIVGA